MKRAFTLLELLVVMGIIAVIVGIAWPLYQRSTQASRAAACLSNLRQLGMGLNLYLGDHQMTMPTLNGGRRSKAEELPVIDNTLNAYLKDPAVFTCPADHAHLAAATGTSYYWNVALNGQPLASLNFLKLSDEQSRIPIIADKEGFHLYTDNKVNVLYADGHVTKELSFIK